MSFLEAACSTRLEVLECSWLHIELEVSYGGDRARCVLSPVITLV
jgi:hypothetical protein